MWVESLDAPGLERFGGDQGSAEFIAFAVGADLLEFSAAVASSRVKRTFNPKPDRKAQERLVEAFDVEGGLTASSFLQHCVADMLAAAVEEERSAVEALDAGVRKRLPVAQPDLDYYEQVRDHYLDADDGSLMVALGALTHRAIALATTHDVGDLPMFRPGEGK